MKVASVSVVLPSHRHTVYLDKLMSGGRGSHKVSTVSLVCATGWVPFSQSKLSFAFASAVFQGLILIEGLILIDIF